MELHETVAMMNSEDYKERFKAEYYQVQIRYVRLKRMVDKYELGILPFKPNCPLEILKKQLAQMFAYLRTLEFRAEIEGIEL